MVLIMAGTGARFAQVKRLRLEDVQPQLSRIMMPASRKGKPKAARYSAVRVGTTFWRLCNLRSKDATLGSPCSAAGAIPK
jgi:hypothetical protein